MNNRRSFIGAGLAPLVVPGSVLGLNGATPPSDRITMAAIGQGPRGRFVLGHFLEQKDVQMVAVSDCFSERRKEAKQIVDKYYGNSSCTTHRLHEDLLSRGDIDAILTAGGDRWHSVMSALAMRAGKDVYCEKPFSLTIAEGRALVELARKSGRVWQCGTQRRSNPTWKFVVNAVQTGRIGKLAAATTSFGGGPWRRTGFPKPEPAPDPDVFDYDRWLGQAPWVPYSKVKVDMWRVNWDTSAGAIADMGAHYFEAVQWARNKPLDGPVEFDGIGFFRNDGGINNTPYHYNVQARYSDGMMLVLDPGPKGVRFDGEEGWIHISDEGVITAEPRSILEGSAEVTNLPAPKGHWNIMAPHIRDFLDCIRSRKQTVSNPEYSQRSHSIIHCACIGLRLGKPLRWDPREERFNNAEANASLSRSMRAPWKI